MKRFRQAPYILQTTRVCRVTWAPLRLPGTTPIATFSSSRPSILQKPAWPRVQLLRWRRSKCCRTSLRGQLSSPFMREIDRLVSRRRRDSYVRRRDRLARWKRPVHEPAGVWLAPLRVESPGPIELDDWIAGRSLRRGEFPSPRPLRVDTRGRSARKRQTETE